MALGSQNHRIATAQKEAIQAGVCADPLKEQFNPLPFPRSPVNICLSDKDPIPLWNPWLTLHPPHSLRQCIPDLTQSLGQKFSPRVAIVSRDNYFKSVSSASPSFQQWEQFLPIHSVQTPPDFEHLYSISSQCSLPQGEESQFLQSIFITEVPHPCSHSHGDD